MSFKFMDFLFFPFAQLDEYLERGVRFSSEAQPKLEMKRSRGN